MFLSCTCSFFVVCFLFVLFFSVFICFYNFFSIIFLLIYFLSFISFHCFLICVLFSYHIYLSIFFYIFIFYHLLISIVLLIYLLIDCFCLFSYVPKFTLSTLNLHSAFSFSLWHLFTPRQANALCSPPVSPSCSITFLSLPDTPRRPMPMTAGNTCSS